MFNRPQLKDSLDIIRFICKEFWGDLFKKQVPPLTAGFSADLISVCTAPGMCISSASIM